MCIVRLQSCDKPQLNSYGLLNRGAELSYASRLQNCISTFSLNASSRILSGCSLTATQMQANAAKRLHKFRNRSHFSRDAKRIYEKTCYSHVSSVGSTVTPVAHNHGFHIQVFCTPTESMHSSNHGLQELFQFFTAMVYIF
ncbi:hypothetical protein CSKR_107138 [Clonorchis sinensis]|uniref:Uncharacterized protein n=1 Tax=Clonorchis sinensis TaxID=79923 RepID=A0A419QDG1_CLOSI|nr:hypothetical protein CSKR_107138 [Clonorchis sinensis]